MSESKSLLARLLAKENISVQHGNYRTGMLKQVGVKRVVFEEPDTRFASRWNLEEVKEYLGELSMEYSTFRRT